MDYRPYASCVSCEMLQNVRPLETFELMHYAVTVAIWHNSCCKMHAADERPRGYICI